jgi:3-oxoacyl-[acyl-carrier-protein] synthase III
MVRVKLLGTGKFLPKQYTSAEELDLRLQKPMGTVLKTSGVQSRYFVDGETASDMGFQAATRALSAAGLTLDEIDCIICASGTKEQAMPSTASLISEKLGSKARGTPAFDIDCTCLSFLVALDMMSYALDAGRFEKIMIISTEIASVGLDWNDLESCSLFGDGAAAAIFSCTPDLEQSKILSSSIETYSEGAHLSEIKGGGTKYHPRYFLESDGAPHLFCIDGKKIYKLSAKVLPEFVSQLLKQAKLTIEDIKLVIPHQASLPALKLVRKRLNLGGNQMMITAPKYGNTIASSIPIALHDAIYENRIERGDIVLLLGTSAGLSIGGIVLEY